MDNRITDVVLSQEELTAMRERADKYEEQDKPLYRTKFRKEDIDFVDNAREDIPKLLAEIGRLQEEVMSLENMLIMAHGCMDVVKYECEHGEVADYLYGGVDE